MSDHRANETVASEGPLPLATKLSCVVLATATCLSIAAASASDLAPAQLVENYISLSIENPDKAKTFLAPDAAWIIFDFGADLAGVFPEFVKHLPESDCSKFLIQTERKVTSDTGVDADVVKVEWKCAKPTEFMLASNVLRFVVVQQKIAMVVVEDPPGYRESRGLPPL
ncbi:hypothetical protein [Mesorhizobium onobrychidis]|uniref:Nuclear transport factor 2 family protein n=1 Tax=Mesorhizobium onobrychidis TaxID=2775404 RepID=A0ABY5QQT9_9HYPH|nr:hypothetical protein [Mesorhizobium onobrychidis]UVC13388.1 hypothetical protein IHQ72_22020 [Mesorhizobium onobrychidis]